MANHLASFDIPGWMSSVLFGFQHMGDAWGDSNETMALLDRVRSGQQDAADQLFERHLERVRRSVQRRMRQEIQTRLDPSDIVQEVHLKGRLLLKDYLRQRPLSFSLWLLKLAHQRIIDYERIHLRASRRSLFREVSLPDESASLLIRHLMSKAAPSPSEAAIRQEHAQLVRRCLAQLPELDREVLLLRIFDGLRNQEVAALLHLAPATTKKRFARALLRIRKLLCGAGID